MRRNLGQSWLTNRFSSSPAIERAFLQYHTHHMLQFAQRRLGVFTLMLGAVAAGATATRVSNPYPHVPAAVGQHDQQLQWNYDVLCWWTSVVSGPVSLGCAALASMGSYTTLRAGLPSEPQAHS